MHPTSPDHDRRDKRHSERQHAARLRLPPPAVGPAGATRTPPATNPSRTRGRLATTCCSLLGLGGSLLCSAAMIAAAVGLLATAGTTVARRASRSGSSIAGMEMATTAASGHLPAWLAALVRDGPPLLVVSLALLAVGVGLRRPAALVPATIGGAILYVGMYQQHSPSWMYAAIVAGTALLLLAYRSSRSSATSARLRRRRQRHAPG
jgi:hypothetical protein